MPDTPKTYATEVHVVSEDQVRIHEFTLLCVCQPYPEIEQDEDGSEVIFIYHKKLHLQ
jgi:hypothetical protein